MNIPEVYLVEPYNAYAPKGRKKHWHEVIEEQALLARILAEQQALQEAASRTLPPTTPDISSPTVGNMNAGAGGNMPPHVWNNPESVTMFAHTPSSGVAPLSVAYSNTMINPHLYTYLWLFSDATGVVSSSTDPNPFLTVHPGADATDVLSASLQVTNSVFGNPIGITAEAYVSASIPVVSSAYTINWPATLTASYYTASAGATLQFVNTSTINNGTALTYLWNFGSASAPTGYDTSTAQTPTYVFTHGATYNVLLSATGSYGLKAAGLRKVYVIDPTITASIASPERAVAGTTGSVPFTVSFVNGTTYDTYADPTYLWVFASGSAPEDYPTSTATNPPDQTFLDAGFYQVRLQVTSSNGTKKSDVWVQILATA